MKKNLFTMTCLCLFLLGLSSCFPTGAGTGTSIAPSRLILTPTTYTTSKPVELPRVTLSPVDLETALLNLLKTNGNCTGKCIGGIRPDTMTTQQAVDTMSQWGMVNQYISPKNNISFSIKQNPLFGQVRVQLAIRTTVDKRESINNMNIRITSATADDFVGTDLWLANIENWQAFRFDNLIKAYDVPSYVGYSFESIGGENNTPLVKDALNYYLVVFFEQINITVSFSGRGNYSEKDMSICPSKDPHNMGIEFNSGVPLKKIKEVYPVTWQATTNSDLNAFFQHFTENSDACTTVTMDKIQTLQPWFH